MRPGKSKYKFENMKICSLIFLCLVLSIFSVVVMIYLTVAVYLPSYREINSDLHETPAVCETIINQLSYFDEICSCSNGCLKRKQSYYCHELHVTVREKGKQLQFQDCSNLHNDSCKMVTDDTNIIKPYSKMLNFTGIARRSEINRSERYDVTNYLKCNPVDKNSSEAEKTDCADYGCYTLSGIHSCENGTCYKYLKPEEDCIPACENNIVTTDKNLFLFENGNLFTAKCGSVIDFETKEVLWTGNQPNEILYTTCNSFENDSSVFKATDCVNGGVLERSDLSQQINLTNYNSLSALYLKVQKMREIRWKEDLLIANQTMLFINLEGCLNSLYYRACDEFNQKYGRLNELFNQRSVFDCFYSKDAEVAVVQYDPIAARHGLLISILIPLGLFLGSFLSLMILSDKIDIGEDTSMRFKCCRKQTTIDPDDESHVNEFEAYLDD